MSRKPIDQQQPTECRGAIWAFIRKMPTFSIHDLLYQTCLARATIVDYLTGLTAAGYLNKLPAPAHLPADQQIHVQYTLVNDIGVDAPRVRKDGTPVTQGQGRQNMWNAMRMLRTFSPTDLAFHSSMDDCQVAESDAKGYIGYLLKAGYLRLVAAGKPGHKPGTGTPARYTLIRTMWSGPHPPQIQRTRQLYDPNLRKVVWSKIEGGAE